MAKDSGAAVLLLGMRLPPNYGKAYNERFEAIYERLATRHALAFVPFFLDGVALDSDLMQTDGIHPQRGPRKPKMLENVLHTLIGLLDPTCGVVHCRYLVGVAAFERLRCDSVLLSVCRRSLVVDVQKTIHRLGVGERDNGARCARTVTEGEGSKSLCHQVAFAA